MYKRILLKLSGEALSRENDCLDYNTLIALANQIKTICDSGIELAIVVGGGNFVRGRTFSKLGFNRVNADYIGMLGTVMNAMALAEVLNLNGVKAIAMSALDIEGVTKYNTALAKQLLADKNVIIFGGGIANPYFSTDTCSALRACEVGCELILMAKNGVDGVYDDDPDTNPNAKRYDVLTFDDILKKELKVIDASAASMCKEYGISAFVFDMNIENNITNAALGLAKGTIIKN